MTIKIRKVTVADLSTLKEISIKTFTDTFGKQNTAKNLHDYLEESYNDSQLKQELENDDSAFYFIFVDHQLAGYLKVNSDNAQSESMDENHFEVERIYILPAFKHFGLGKQLINYAIKLTKVANKKVIWLGVWERNFAAQGFYNHLGFQRISEHSFYMGTDPQTDYILEKSI